MHAFDAALALSLEDRSDLRCVFRGAAQDSFRNLIGPFGGWGAAILAEALAQSVPDGFELVSLTTDYCAGVPSGPVRIITECDRAGRSTHFWTARLYSEAPDAESGVALKASAILARRREGTTAWQEGSIPEVAAPEECPRREIPRNWAEQIEIRAAGTQRYAAAGRTHSMAWTRFEAPRALDMPGLVAFADTPLTRLFLVLKKFTPISTVTKTVYLHASAEDYASASEDYLLVEAEGARGGRGFYDQFAKLWTRDGRLLATSQQMVWYKAEDPISTAA